MNCISKYLVTNEDERRVLRLARNFAPESHGLWRWPEDSEFFHRRYYPTMKAINEYMAMEPSKQPMLSLDPFWKKACRDSKRELIKEAQEIKRREIDPKNVMYNVGIFALQSVFVGLSMGLLFRYNEDAFRQNYKK